jgi:hypothetical protein
LAIGVGVVMAGLASAIAHFTLKLELHVSPDAARDVAVLFFVGFATLMAICHSRLN